jgi:glycerophosphoryl diester phosphodiesterase
MRLHFLTGLLALFSTTCLCQDFQVHAKPYDQSIEAFTKLMDDGAHALRIPVTTNKKNQLVVDSTLLLREVIKALEWHTKSYTQYEIKYVIELQTSPNYQKEVKTVHDLLDEYIPLDRVTIHSADFKILTYWKKNYPEIKLSLHINNNKSVDTNLANLGFKPTIYSPNHESFSKKKVTNLHRRSIKVIPWMVNDSTTMHQLIRWKVDGFITNAPKQSQLLGVNKEVKSGH